MKKKSNGEIQLRMYLNEVDKKGRALTTLEMKDNNISYKVLYGYLKKIGYSGLKDFRDKHNIKDAERVNKNKLDLADIIESYKIFYKENKRFPTSKECTTYEYLHSRNTTINILKQNNMTFKDLYILISGEEYKNTTSLSRINGENYNIYKQRYIEICNNLNRPLAMTEFNQYNDIPDYRWFINYCPNDEIKNYVDFYKWCGLKRQYDTTKEEAKKIIFDMQSELDRPLMYEDFKSINNKLINITTIKKHWGTMNKMKKELGLEIIQEDMVSKHIDDVEIIINEIKNVCDLVYNNENRKTIMTNDITKYNKLNLSIQSFNKICKQNNTTVRKIVESYDYKYQKEGTGMVIYYDDGEVTKSSFEYLFTNKLRELGYEYNKKYFRDVRYRTFIDDYNKRLDCDYKIHIDNKIIYIEIAGMLNNYEEKYKNNQPIPSKAKTKYAEKLNEKENMFIKNCLDYFILFPSDLKEENLDKLFKDILHINKINETKEDLIDV